MEPRPRHPGTDDTITVLLVASDASIDHVSPAGIESAHDAIDVVPTTDILPAGDLLDDDLPVDDLHEIDCVVTRSSLEGMSPVEYIDELRSVAPAMPVVTLVGPETTGTAEDILERELVEYVTLESQADTTTVLAHRIVQLVEASEARTFSKATRQRPFDVADRIRDALFALDTEWRFTYLNERSEALFGRSADELVGNNIWTVIDEAADSEFYDLYHEAMETQEQQTIEVYFDAWGRWYREYLYPSPEGLSVLSHDVTERKEQEAELHRQNDRLDRFADTISHDLRNPLNVAQGRLALARESCDSEQLEYVEQAHDRIQRLVEDLLTLARQGEAISDPVPVDLTAVTRSSWRTVQTGDATLEIENPGLVLADESRLTQLLENLFRNAIDHAGPTVTVTVSGLEDGFVVADDGPGISTESKHRIFERGYTTAGDGGGFGLVIVKEIAEAHGWTMRVATDADGARFEFHDVVCPRERHADSERQS